MQSHVGEYALPTPAFFPEARVWNHATRDCGRPGREGPPQRRPVQRENRDRLHRLLPRNEHREPKPAFRTSVYSASVLVIAAWQLRWKVPVRISVGATPL